MKLKLIIRIASHSHCMLAGFSPLVEVSSRLLTEYFSVELLGCEQQQNMAVVVARTSCCWSQSHRRYSQCERHDASSFL